MTVTPLCDLVVVDLSDSVAGQYCGRLLALNGSEVALVEPPGGCSMRVRGQIDERRGVGHSFLFEHLNQNKASIVVDESQTAGRSRLAELIAAADVVIHDGRTDLPPLHPSAIECVARDFPAGPYESWIGTEMIHQALSGVMNATGTAGREPIYGVGERAGYAAGTTAYISVLAALVLRRRDGIGDRIDVTRYEALAAMGQNLVSQYSFNGTSETRARYPGFLAMLRCADAWMVLFAIRNWEPLCRVLGRDDLATDERFATQADRLARWDEIVAELGRSAAAWRADDLVAALQASRISAETVTSLAALVGSDQWRNRSVLGDVDVPGDRPRQQAVARPFQITGVATGARRAAPRLGEHGDDVLITGSATDRSDMPAGAGETVAAGSLPLEGVTVLEFTTAWAGPFAGRCLAALGAEVIKVEAPSHLDSWRGPLQGGAPHFYPEFETGSPSYDRSLLFCSQNIDKGSLALDLKRPGGADVLGDLAAQADIVLANFTPGVLDRLGAGFDRLNAINPRLSVVEMPAFGPGGPLSAHQGMGKTMEPAAGITALMGYDAETPVLTGPAFMDPTGGLHGVAAVLTALAYRHRTGRGCRIEVAQVEAAANWIGEFVLEQLATGSTFEPMGNHARGWLVHDAFPCLGNDQWVAIAVGAEHAEALAGLLDQSAPAFTDPEAIRAALAAWTATRDKSTAAIELQAQGIPAAPVLSGGDVANDEAMHIAGMIVTLDHPRVGRRSYSDVHFRGRRWRAHHRRAAPTFGEHNRDILVGRLGISPERFDELRALGTVADVPVGAPPPTPTPQLVEDRR